jgi:hypothetical protein
MDDFRHTIAVGFHYGKIDYHYWGSLESVIAWIEESFHEPYFHGECDFVARVF